MEKNKKYYILGFFFLFIQFVAIVRNFFSDYYIFFWFCDFVSLPLAIGFFLKKEDFIKSLVNIGLLPQLIYVVSYSYMLITGNPFLDTIPRSTNLFYALSSMFIHLSIPLAFLFTYNFRPRIKTLFYSLMSLFVMYVVALFFTTQEQGVNYVLSSRTLTSFIIPYYTELWVLLAFLIVILPTQLLQYLVYKHSVRKIRT